MKAMEKAKGKFHRWLEGGLWVGRQVNSLVLLSRFRFPACWNLRSDSVSCRPPVADSNAMLCHWKFQLAADVQTLHDIFILLFFFSKVSKVVNQVISTCYCGPCCFNSRQIVVECECDVKMKTAHDLHSSNSDDPNCFFLRRKMKTYVKFCSSEAIVYYQIKCRILWLSLWQVFVIHHRWLVHVVGYDVITVNVVMQHKLNGNSPKTRRIFRSINDW